MLYSVGIVIAAHIPHCVPPVIGDIYGERVQLAFSISDRNTS
jgi:hypothetical protein